MGDQDELIPANDLLLQSSLLQKPFFHQITAAGHMSMLETPGELKTILKNYVLAVTAES
jgi:pimeloyl-ACP methyl ester carboxylesterase